MITLIIFQLITIILAYEVRGYFAIGGEYFIIPLIYFTNMLIETIKEDLKTWI